MNKKLLVKAVAEEVGMTQKDTEIVLDAVVSKITETLENGEEVSITGFGKFVVAERPARVGHNPSNGEEIQIAASKAPKFRASKALKDAINA